MLKEKITGFIRDTRAYWRIPAEGDSVAYKEYLMLSLGWLGMRLATVTPRDLFGNPRIYLSTAIKNVVYPLLSFLIIYFSPLPTYIKVTFFLLGCCPAASMVLNMSELVGDGQTQAACSVLISTISCIITIPLLALMIPLL